MNKLNPQGSKPPDDLNKARRVWFIAAGCSLVVLIALFAPRQQKPDTNQVSAPHPSQIISHAPAGVKKTRERGRPSSAPAAALAPTAEEIVAGKVSQFARNRREVMHAMARRFKVEVPADVEKF